MAIVQCENNHYYDNSRDEVCPYCMKLRSQQTTDEDNSDEQPTVYKAEHPDDDTQLTEAYGEFTDDDDKTIGVYSVRNGNLLTAGWLVCIKGEERGKSIPFFSGRNFAGRDENMDIVLGEDKRIARDKHFSVVYDPVSVRYFAVEGGGSTYVNEKPLIGQREIFENDKINVGESSYYFIPYCNKELGWV